MKRFANCIATGLVVTLVLATIVPAQKKSGGGSSGAAAAAPAATTSSTAPFEVEMLTYGALDKVIDRLSGYACSVKPTIAGKTFGHMVVLDPPALQALQAYDAFSVNAKALATAYSALQGTAPAGSGIDDFSDVTNAIAAAAIATTAETSFSFTIQYPTATIVLLNHLRSNTSCEPAYYAGVYAANEAFKPSFRGSEISSISDQLAV